MVGQQLDAVVHPAQHRVVDDGVVDLQRVLEVAQLPVLHALVVAREDDVHAVGRHAHVLQQQAQWHAGPAVAAEGLQAPGHVLVVARLHHRAPVAAALHHQRLRPDVVLAEILDLLEAQRERSVDAAEHLECVVFQAGVILNVIVNQQVVLAKGSDVLAQSFPVGTTTQKHRRRAVSDDWGRKSAGAGCGRDADWHLKASVTEGSTMSRERGQSGVRAALRRAAGMREV